MRVTAMAVAMQPVRCAAETAIDLLAIGLAVRAGHERKPGAAVASPHKPHRYSANGRRTHHGQHNTAGTFHGTSCCPAKHEIDIETELIWTGK